jgi:hypothetical protein
MGKQFLVLFLLVLACSWPSDGKATKESSVDFLQERYLVLLFMVVKTQEQNWVQNACDFIQHSSGGVLDEPSLGDHF